MGDSVQLEAFDIDTSQCPPREWLPLNVAVETLDIFQPVPARFVEKYNLINIRYFACIVRNNDPTPIIRNVLKMLSTWGLSHPSCRFFNCIRLLQTEPTLTLFRTWWLSTMVRARLRVTKDCGVQ